MGLQDLPKYKDIRKTIRKNGEFPVVGTAVKDTHVIHHSMTEQGLKGSTPEGFANTHIDKNKWPGIAYAFVIMPDGTIYHCNDLDRRTYHAGDTNTRSIGTCLVGDFRKEGAAEKPTMEQVESLYLLNKELYKLLPNMKLTIGHQECPGYSWKNCPGDTWSYKDAITGKGLAPDDGWVKVDNRWVYYKNGKRHTGWIKEKNKWYYLDAAGIMQTGWVKDKGKWYYLKSNGEMAQGWLKDKGKWYYLNPANNRGEMLADTVIQDKGKFYYLNSDGSMAENTNVKIKLKAGKGGALTP